MTQIRYEYGQAEFLKLDMDKTNKLQDFHIVNDNTVVVEYDHDDSSTHVPGISNGNIIVAAFTTCWARLPL